MIPAFKDLDGSSVILRYNKRGIYYQATLSELGGFVFAKVRGGFIKLYANGTTTDKFFSWEQIDYGLVETTKDSLGRVVLQGSAADQPRLSPPVLVKKQARLVKA